MLPTECHTCASPTPIPSITRLNPRLIITPGFQMKRPTRRPSMPAKLKRHCQQTAHRLATHLGLLQSPRRTPECLHLDFITQIPAIPVRPSVKVVLHHTLPDLLSIGHLPPSIEVANYLYPRMHYLPLLPKLLRTAAMTLDISIVLLTTSTNLTRIYPTPPIQTTAPTHPRISWITISGRRTVFHQSPALSGRLQPGITWPHRVMPLKRMVTANHALTNINHPTWIPRIVRWLSKVPSRSLRHNVVHFITPLHHPLRLLQPPVITTISSTPPDRRPPWAPWHHWLINHDQSSIIASDSLKYLYQIFNFTWSVVRITSCCVPPLALSPEKKNSTSFPWTLSSESFSPSLHVTTLPRLSWQDLLYYFRWVPASNMFPFVLGLSSSLLEKLKKNKRKMTWWILRKCFFFFFLLKYHKKSKSSGLF